MHIITDYTVIQMLANVNLATILIYIDIHLHY